MTQLAVVAAAGLLIGLATAGTARPVLRLLQRTRQGEDEPPYDELGTPSFLAGCGVAAGSGGALAWWLLPLALQPAWVVLATAGVLLAAIDAQTTWLPWRLTRIAWVLMILGLATGLLLGGSASLVLRAAAGAAAAGVLYLGAWAGTRGGFGFGDVRFAPLLGAATAAHSWSLLVSALVLGTVAGGLYGVIRLVRQRRDPFPYGPSMLAGAFAAVATLALE